MQLISRDADWTSILLCYDIYYPDVRQLWFHVDALMRYERPEQIPLLAPLRDQNGITLRYR